VIESATEAEVAEAGETQDSPEAAGEEAAAADDSEGEAKDSPEAADDEDAEAEADEDAEAEGAAADDAGDENEGSSEAADEEAAAADDADDEPEFASKPRPPAKLERLQKILAQAGIASRRKAEEMIEQGRVQVNGKTVTELGTKADAGRDHIRVDGKLLQGAERLRYFVLNKPKGFVTTVKDPEGRPTVMQFFEKMRERLYPVGRLDYMSEGLLLVTNDGELANRLTRAAAGVEKTYLVKVAGQPTEAELNILRGGVAIERGKPGSAKVRTSPARIRQVRQGDNPWYEVVLIEGRNRELRKMFEEVGHFVEKIRRVGYGPLVLDQEPGNLRELEPEELVALRRVAEGKLRTPKSKEVRRRNAMDAAGLPTVSPRPTPRPRPAKPYAAKAFDEGSATAGRPGEFRPKRAFGTSPARPFRPAAGRSVDRGPARSDDRPRSTGAGPSKFGSARPSFRPSARPAWVKDDRPSGPPARFAEGATGAGRPFTGRPSSGRPSTGRTYGAGPAAGKPYGSRPAAGRPFADKPARGNWSKPSTGSRPPFKSPAAPRREAPVPEQDMDMRPSQPVHLSIEPIQESERSSRPSRPYTPRPYADRSGAGRPSSARPFRAEGGMPRPFTTSSGKPRAGGARPSSKPGKPGADRPYSPSSRTGSGYRPSPGGKRTYDGKPAGAYSRPSFRRDEGEGAPRSPRPYTPRAEGSSSDRPSSRGAYPNSASRADRKTGSGWKPKPSFGGAGKPASGGHSKPKSGYKGKPAGGKKRY
jgi:23S rRNA pseudouridine2605 synthase